ncbi:hypothetical protein FZI91_03230 [Mycobacterium sp. CBMA271]|uniref:DUF7832 domain-containing protein n=1 Tax=unclassified Mycobacteroides TaxID=2618759 RepID=UPI0012DD5040|nr:MULTISPECIES: hypothetical protein [unclassified Mycobacteroides]MUM18132.1 hypothetical protein [Mycobacteroides sp. CBMA 326]MUM20718.1 hypothetical protein [Mycobacteroides sp. CBMA 271]
MTYDDAGWHYDSVGDLGLPYEAASTHIGMFMAWLALHDMLSPAQTDGLSELSGRLITPGEYLRDHCVNQIDPFMLNSEGNAFAEAMYKTYLKRYGGLPALSSYGSTYEASDTWLLYDEVDELMMQLYGQWKLSTT